MGVVVVVVIAAVVGYILSDDSYFLLFVHIISSVEAVCRNRDREREVDEDEEEAYERKKLERRLREKEAAYQEVSGSIHLFSTST